MKSRYRYSLIASLAGLLAVSGCVIETRGSSSSGPVNPTGGNTTDGSFIRVHYRLQGTGDPRAWGVHFWGAGSTSPEWGKPQLFDQSDEFGVYTDIEVTAIQDMTDAWLGLIPVQCTDGNCQKDVETGVRFVDLEKNASNPNIGECWITQGQAIQTTRPTTTGPAYKIARAGDFIDLGDGRVRLMFRAAPGSEGTVAFGAAPGTLDKQATWTAADDINKNGLVLTGLTPGKAVYYKISTTLKANAQDLKDETAELQLTPIKVDPIVNAADWASWGGQGIMYQLIVRTFADGGSPKAAANPGAESGIDPAKKDGVGDLVGLKNSLPYLKDLGADAIWMTPVFKAKSYHGYDTTDFYDIDPAVGTRKDFEDLAQAAHAQGINIILDLVQNHVADVNPWFIAGADPKSPDFDKYHDWFVWSDEYSNMVADKHPWDASAVIWACKNYMCYHQIFGTPMPELNYRNPEVRAEMKKIAKFWIDLGADGYRLDASKHIDQFDDNNAITLDQHGTHVWWKEFNYYVKKDVVRPAGSATVLLTGENRWDDPAVYQNMLPYGGDMDSQFDFPFRSIVANFINGKAGDEVDFAKYANTLRADLAAAGKGGNPNHFFERFLSNHDLERPATQFEGAAMLDAILKQAATIVLTIPGMPVIYYGEEFGKKGKRDKYLGTEGWDHDEFIREPMSWFEQVSFTGDKMTSWNIDFEKTNTDNAALNLGVGVCVAPNPDYPFIKYMTESDPASWAAQKDEQDSLFNHYKKLVAIRKANPVITDPGAVLDTVQNTPDVYEFTLSNGADTLTVVLNRKGSAQTFTRPLMVEDLLTGTQGTSFDVPAHGALILK
ncbi:MAG TPA: alpha-amylase family glycosyl hydrolase [Polyangiaceae bacterium]|jgi:glycosidase|nr:alpha-amylase family glycosyl hydrolase [Polyangiaceae bacterium]